MKFGQARAGRVFVIRLEDGDVIHETLERFARDQDIRAASLIILGGADAGSRLIVGPRDGRAKSIDPMQHVLPDVHEIAGTGTIFPDENGRPVLHMHIAAGRDQTAVAGCARAGVKTWLVAEVILWELLDTAAVRRRDSATGFELLDPA